MMSFLTNGLLVVAILGAGFLFGTDAFFALVGQRAIARANAAASAEVMGRIHETADQRVPLVGATTIVTTLLASLLSGWGTASGRLALLALVLQLAFLGIYLSYSRPINAALTAAAVQHTTPLNDRTLQTRWDRVIGLRAVLLLGALGALSLAALLR